MSTLRNVLVTGATGYVGGRIVPRLLEAGYQVRVLVRDPHRLQGRAWADQVEMVVGDALKPETLGPAMVGMDAAYYLIHSMNDSVEFHQRDLMAARHFAQAARQAGVQRLIYLGGLGDPDTDLSQHLRSRHQTGDALRQAGVPVTEFRSAIIVGSGSISFEMIRNLTERVPIMICPRWVYTRIQPISIGDVLDYLVSALQVPESADEIIEIGGADVLTYAEMMLGYARARGLKRFLIPVPVLTPFLSSYWVHWMTPVPANIARPLIEGLRNEVIVRDQTAHRLFPHIKPVDYATAVRMALDRLNSGEIETSWTDALITSQGDRPPVVLAQQEGMIIEQRQHVVAAPAQIVFDLFTGLGGERGWLSLNWAWRLRGILDRLVGGVGFRRGRRHPDHLRVGDALDFWRVEAVQAGRLLRLRAEMKVPGRAWLQFEARPQPAEHTLLVQTAFFAPKGLTGLLYWYLLYPIHALIFSRLIREIARRAQAAYQRTAATSPV
ncbi:MAG: SDR family oxidoreductase [Acidobacteriota bacterium]|nr:SDR family oxidoreductase [Blastocatellia bacterium]MDW8240809.1 SDR family oxidoreductase [Acidobacteriota bacterium]